MIHKIEYCQILPIWENFLWPGRLSIVEPYSAIIYGNYPYKIDMNYSKSECFCFGIFEGNELVGVNSGHVTGESFRSRGLYVKPDYRKSGYGKMLLDAVIDKGEELGCKFVWSIPRQSSFSVYQSCGYIQTSEWFQTETSEHNCFVKIDL